MYDCHRKKFQPLRNSLGQARSTSASMTIKKDHMRCSAPKSCKERCKKQYIGPKSRSMDKQLRYRISNTFQTAETSLKIDASTELFGQRQPALQNDPAIAATEQQTLITLLVKIKGSDMPATQISLPSQWSLALFKSSLLQSSLFSQQHAIQVAQLSAKMSDDFETAVSLAVQGRLLNQASDTKICDIASLSPYSLVVCHFNDSEHRLVGGSQTQEGYQKVSQKPSGTVAPTSGGSKKSIEEEASELGVQVETETKNKKSVEQAAVELGISVESKENDNQLTTLLRKKAKEAEALANDTSRTIEQQNVPVKKSVPKVTSNQVGVEEKAFTPPLKSQKSGDRQSTQEDKEDKRSQQELMKAFNEKDKKFAERTGKSLHSSSRLSQAEKENLTEIDNLAMLIARKQVEDYNLSEAKEKQLLEKHLQGYKSGGAHEIKSASEFINATSKTYSFVEYLWASRGWQYDAFLCKLPGIDSVNASKTYKLFVRESAQHSHKKIVFGHSFSLANQPENFSLNGNSLWILERPTEKNKSYYIRIITFKYKFGDELTDSKEEQRFYLPEGISVRRAASIADDESSHKNQLIRNLQQQHQYARPQYPETLESQITNQVNRMIVDNHSQIALMRFGTVFVNTEERGLVQFTMDKIAQKEKSEEENKENDEEKKKEEEKLTPVQRSLVRTIPDKYEEKEEIMEMQITDSDLKDVPGLKGTSSFVKALFRDRRNNTLSIFSEDLENGIVQLSVREAEKKEYKETSNFKFDQPYPIIKAQYHEGGRIFILDTYGGAKVINPTQEKIFDIGQQCFEILVTPETLYSWHLTTNNNNQLITVLRKREIGSESDKKITSLSQSLMTSVRRSRADHNADIQEKEAAQKMNQDLSDDKLCQILANQDYIVSFFSHSMSIEGRLLLANGKTLYAKDGAVTLNWLSCLELESQVLALYPVDKKPSQELVEFICVTEKSVQTIRFNLTENKFSIKYGRIEGKKHLFAGKAISCLKAIKNSWCSSNILIMTLGRNEKFIKDEQEKEEEEKEKEEKKKENKGITIDDKEGWKRQLRLWSCSPTLELTLLLQDQEREHLDPNSFYAFLNVDREYFKYNATIQKQNDDLQSSSNITEGSSDKLAIVCSLQGYTRDFNLYPMPESPKEKPKCDFIENLEQQKPVIEQDPVKLKDLSSLDFEHSKTLQLFEVNKGQDEEKGQEQRFYAIIANGENLKTSIIILNHELKLDFHSDFDNVRITQVTDKVQEGGHIFALDDQFNLVKLDINLLKKGGLALYKLINFAENGRTVLSVDSKSIWLMHASGITQRILKLPFTGRLSLEGSGSENGDYLLWKQYEHILAAVNRFNVVSFWNTLTGELFHKKIIKQEKDRILDARKYKCHEYQARYEEPGKQFDTVSQTLVCYKKESKTKQDEFECQRVKIMKLHVFEDHQSAFEASCELLCTAKISQYQIKEGRTFFYNDDLETIFATEEDGHILVFKQQTELIDPEDAEWVYDYSSSEQLTSDIGLQGKGNKLLENHISPDGRHVLHCSVDGLRVLQFEKTQAGDHEVIALSLKEWKLPLRTDMEPLELAKRVRFESKNVIRYFKPGYDRDLLFRLGTDGKTVTYLSEVKVENLFGSESHFLVSRSFENEFESFMHSNRLFRTSFWHRLNLDELKSNRGGEQLKADDVINRVDMISPVMKQSDGFEAQLAFSTFEWLQAEKVADGEIMLADLSDKRRLQLSMGIFPQATTLLHLIASKSSKEDQSSGALQIQALLEAESGFADESITGTEEGDQIQIPILVNALGKTPFRQMHDTGRRVLLDKLMAKVPFHRIINYLEEVEELLKQEDPNLLGFIESSLQENESTALIGSLDLPPSTYLITFRSASTTPDQLEVQEEVNRSLQEKELAGALAACSEPRTVNTKVKVRFMDIRWLLRGGTGFLDFVTVLRNYKRDKLFETDFLSSLTHEYWVVYQRKIIWRTLLPWVVFSGLSVLYFAWVLDGSFEDGAGGQLLAWRIIAGLLGVLICYQLFVEVRQIIDDYKDYFSSFYNYNDLFQYFGTLWIVVINAIPLNMMNLVNQRDMASILIISQGVKAVIDWLRLFDVTSFYVTLIVRTVLDIGYFGLILFVMVAYIGVATYMLQLNAEAGEDASIISPVFGNFMVDSVVNQYLLMLGEFHMDGFGGHVNAALCYTLFALTTFIMQITFLNMLIAIMGDTFDKVIDQRPTFSLKNKLMILAGMETLIRSKQDFDVAKVFLFVIQPAGAGGDEGGGVDSESDNWRGKVYYTHSLIKAKSAGLSAEIQQIAKEQKNRVAHLAQLVADQQGKMQRQIDGIAAATDQLLRRSNGRPQNLPQGAPDTDESVQAQITGMDKKIEDLQSALLQQQARDQKWQSEMKEMLAKLKK